MTPNKFKNHQEWLEWEKDSVERLRQWKDEKSLDNWTKTNCRPITPLYKEQSDEQYYLLDKIGNLCHD